MSRVARLDDKRTRRRRDDDPIIENEPAQPDEAYPLVPEGEDYEVQLVRCVLREMWGSLRWICWFVVLNAKAKEAIGLELPMYLPRPKNNRARPSRSWAMTAAYAVATGRRPPRNLGVLNPTAYLTNAIFRVRVVDVTRDQHGAPVPPGARYSRIKNLLERLTGKGNAS